MIKIILLSFLAIASARHTQHDQNEELKELVKKMSEKIEALEQKLATLEDAREIVQQTPVTYVAAVTAGYPISTSTDWDSIHTAINGLISRPLPRDKR